MKRLLGRGAKAFSCGALLCASLAARAHAQVIVENQMLTTIEPCRLIDTRFATAGKLDAGETRSFEIFGDLSAQGGAAAGCGLPGFTADGAPQTQALEINYVAVNPEAQGNLKAWPSDLAEPATSVINFNLLSPPTNLANGTVTAVRQDVAGGELTIKASQRVHVVADVVGYFQRHAVRTEITGSEAVDPSKAPNVIGGSAINSVTAGVVGATIAGGGATFSGPQPNVVSADFGTVGGGRNNLASGARSTVGGGGSNTASGDRATVGGGGTNTASNTQAVVSGGISNTASGIRSTVGGGNGNTASGGLATVSGGASNVASGAFASVPGGLSNQAAGDYSFAMGNRAKVDAAHDGAFLFADHTDADFNSSAADQFLVRASGGTTFFSNSALTTGVNLPAGGGAWSVVSDRGVKENFRPLDPRVVVEKVAALPIAEWNYRTQDSSIRHLGPVAQDFHAAFGLGEDDRHISTVDADGVALAAIQGLYRMLEQKLDQKDAEIAELKRRLEVVERSAAERRHGPLRRRASENGGDGSRRTRAMN